MCDLRVRLETRPKPIRLCFIRSNRRSSTLHCFGLCVRPACVSVDLSYFELVEKACLLFIYLVQ
jgi:hypothetical protein